MYFVVFGRIMHFKDTVDGVLLSLLILRLSSFICLDVILGFSYFFFFFTKLLVFFLDILYNHGLFYTWNYM